MLPLSLLLATSVATCPSAAFVTYEGDKIAAVTWTERSATELRSHSVLNQTLIVDSTVALRPDQSATHDEARHTVFGSPGDKPVARDAGPGAIFWSDFVPSGLEQAVLRARAVGAAKTTVTGDSLWADKHTELEVERRDPTDWVVRVNRKRYEILTDEHGCMLSATLPDRGVVIERRTDLSRAQYPLWTPYGAPPDHAYQASDVSIHAPQGHTLAGTLTRPLHARRRLPAVVFITGISPHERNCGTAPFMPFRDLADTLTRAGVATLRFDDRGVAKSTGDYKTITISDKADDVQTAVAWLRARKDIDPKRIFLVGYSEGGTIAPMVAGRDPTLAGIVTIAGDGVPPWELARYQIEAAVMADPSVAPADKQKEIEKELADPLTPHEKSFMDSDPIQLARKVKVPALITQGGSDLHVPPRSAERLAWAMRESGNRDVTVRLFAGMSHLIVPDPVGLAAFWVMAPGYVTFPALQETIAQWIAAHAR